MRFVPPLFLNIDIFYIVIQLELFYKLLEMLIMFVSI